MAVLCRQFLKSNPKMSEKAKTVVPLRTIKVVVIGDGAVGKTRGADSIKNIWA